MKAKGTISFKLKNQLGDLKKLNLALEKIAGNLGMAKKCQCETNLVMEELFTNIIHYGFHDKAEHQIEISFSIKDNMLIIKIEDDGVPFNPVDSECPDVDETLEEREIGGLGVFLAKQFSDEIEYQRKNGKNILIMKKEIDQIVS